MALTSSCPCGTGKPFDQCCQPYIEGWSQPETPEALMRSRFTAYTREAIDYLEATSGGDALADFSKKDAAAWARRVTFTKLEVVSSSGGADDDAGAVEFVATFEEDGKTRSLREHSRFERDPQSRLWKYVGREKGVTVKAAPKVGRNDPCPCGSGLKYKKCHGA